MVAYSFKARFIDPIRAGTKRQTIRALGKKRHARPGDQLQLYCGLRTKRVRLISREVCREVVDVKLLLKPPLTNDPFMGAVEIRGGKADVLLHTLDALDRFAVLDGFGSWRDMMEFWQATHPEAFRARVFEGPMILW